MQESDLILEIFEAIEAHSGGFKLLKDREDVLVKLYSSNAELIMEYRLKGFKYSEVRAGLKDLGISSQPSLPMKSEAFRAELCK